MRIYKPTCRFPAKDSHHHFLYSNINQMDVEPISTVSCEPYAS